MDYTTLVNTLKQDRHTTDANEMVIAFLDRKTANLSDSTYHDLDPLKWTLLAEEFNHQLLLGKTKVDIYKNSVLTVDNIFGEGSTISQDLKIYFAEQVVKHGINHVQNIAKDTMEQAKDMFNQFDSEKFRSDFKKETAEAVTTVATVFSGLKASMGKFRSSIQKPKDESDKNKM